MEDQLISFETAKLAREKGFDRKCRYYFTGNPTFTGDGLGPESNHNKKNCYFSRPTQSLLQRWLREVHKIYVTIDYHLPPTMARYKIEGPNVHDKQVIMAFGDYEKALEHGLVEALNLLP